MQPTKIISRMLKGKNFSCVIINKVKTKRVVVYIC